MANVEVINEHIVNDSNNSINIKTKKKRVCAYCRVSTDELEQRTSYLSQINHYSELIRKNKDWEFVGVYADEGITGTQIKNRDEFIRMLEDCKSGKIDMVIAKSISRFARNTVDTLNTVRLLRDLGINVYFEKENINTLNMDSEMFLTLYSAFAQAESESTSMNVKLGYKAKMKRGEPCGTIGCYGFNWDKIDKKITINKKEAEVVKKIFKYYLDGKGTTVIARLLTEENIPAPAGGKKWHAGVIKDMLRNVKYVGDLCGQKYFVENPMTHKLVKNRGQKPKYYVKEHHDAIIDREDFNKVQEIYSSRSKKIKDGKEYCEKFSLRYTFSSKIFCGNCGQTYVRRYTKYKNKDGVVHDRVYWVCSSKLHKIDCNKAVTIRDEELKSLFIALFNKFLNNSRNDDLIKKIKTVISTDNSETKILKIDKKMKHVQDKILKLIDLNLNGNIDKDSFVLKNEELNNELNSLKKEKEELNDSQKHIKKEERRLKEIEKELNRSKTLYKFDDEIFKKLVNKIIIGEYNSKNEYDPYVVKFVLNIKNIHSENSTKFLSLQVDERNNKTFKV